MKKFKITYTKDEAIGIEETIEANSFEEAMTVFIQLHPEANDWTIEEV